MDIKRVEVLHEILKNQFIECIDESFITELRDGMRGYDGVTLQELLTHVFKNYGKMDNHLINAKRQR